MNEDKQTSAPQDQSSPAPKSSFSANISSAVSLAVAVATYQAIDKFAPEGFFFSLLFAVGLLGVGTAVGFWVTRSRFRQIQPLRSAIALSFGQAMGMAIAVTLADLWRTPALADLGIMAMLTAWLFFRPSPLALKVALAHQILSTGSRLWGLIGPSTVATQLPWVVIHALTVWALISAIRPLQLSLRSQGWTSAPITESRSSVQSVGLNESTTREETVQRTLPLAATSQPVTPWPGAGRAVHVPQNADEGHHSVPRHGPSLKWIGIGTGALVVCALLAGGGGYLLGRNQAYAKGLVDGVIEGDKTGYDRGYEEGGKETAERTRLELARSAESHQAVAFLAGFDSAMDEVWGQFREPMKSGRWYMIKVSDKIESGPLLLAEHGAAQAKDAMAVRFQLGIWSDRKPPRLTITSYVPMAEGSGYELRDDGIWGRTIR